MVSPFCYVKKPRHSRKTKKKKQDTSFISDTLIYTVITRYNLFFLEGYDSFIHRKMFSRPCVRYCNQCFNSEFFGKLLFLHTLLNNIKVNTLSV